MYAYIMTFRICYKYQNVTRGPKVTSEVHMRKRECTLLNPVYKNEPAVVCHDLPFKCPESHYSLFSGDPDEMYFIGPVLFAIIRTKNFDYLAAIP